jgi:hypothetical protein
MSLRSDTGKPVTAESLPPIGPRRTAFNRAILEAGVRAWDRRRPREVRRRQRKLAA